MANPPSTSIKPLRIALIGNPNSGKTSLFNLLTGSRQKIGNYAGVTVERAVGTVKLDSIEAEVLDIPGLYSLNPVSADENIAFETLKGNLPGEAAPDLLLAVIDGTNLERNLYLLSQVMELGIPMLVAVTMVDVVQSSGNDLDTEVLAEQLGVPVFPLVTHRGRGVTALKQAMEQALTTPPEAPTGRAPATVQARYQWAEDIRKAALKENPALRIRHQTDKIDRILTHRVWGLLLFILVMYAVFQSIYTLAGPLMDLIEMGFSWAGETVSGAMTGPEWLRSLVVDGVIAGIGSVAIFLPQILILFGLISILEGSGYLARASFLMDKVLGWCGLNGKAFIPLLSSYACAIPGIMAARIMPDAKSRLATILVAPLMSCSARLPVYILLIGAFIEPQYGAFVAGLTLFGMHLVGLFIAIPFAWFLNRKVLKGGRVPFMMELPPYQAPRWKDVIHAMVSKAKAFIQTAGTVIVAMSILIWAGLYFPRSEEAFQGYEAAYATKSAEFKERVPLENYLESQHLEDSYLGQFGHAIEPVLAPAGFDWRISTAILAAFPAREVLVSSLGIIFDLGGDADENSVDLRESLQRATWPDGRKLFTPATAFALMVFFALCCQCGSTLAAMKRETGGWKWPAIAFGVMTGMAWLCAVLIQQTARLFGG